MKGKNISKWNNPSKPKTNKPLHIWQITYKGPNSYRVLEYTSSRKPTTWAKNHVQYKETFEIAEKPEN